MNVDQWQGLKCLLQECAEDRAGEHVTIYDNEYGVEIKPQLSPAVFHILLALAEEERHGYATMQEVQENTDGQVNMGPGTLYGSISGSRLSMVLIGLCLLVGLTFGLYFMAENFAYLVGQIDTGSHNIPW